MSLAALCASFSVGVMERTRLDPVMPRLGWDGGNWPTFSASRRTSAWTSSELWRTEHEARPPSPRQGGAPRRDGHMAKRDASMGKLYAPGWAVSAIPRAFSPVAFRASAREGTRVAEAMCIRCCPALDRARAMPASGRNRGTISTLSREASGPRAAHGPERCDWQRAPDQL